MKFLIWFVVLIAASQARPWQDDESKNCSIAADAKAMENIFRAERLIINLIEPYKLKDFLLNVTETILKEIQGGNQFIRFLHLTQTDEQIKMHVQSNQGYLEGLFNGVESLSQINTSNINYFLRDAHWDFARLLRDLEYSYSYSIRRRLNQMLQRVISRCQNIVKNGCKEGPSRPDEGTTESPWRPDEGTTEGPWRPDEGHNNNTIRLVLHNGGPQPSEGRLEVRHNGQWGTVCDDGFSNVTAEVACKMLGFDTGTAEGEAPFGGGSGPIWLDEVRCNGTESSLFECRHNGWGNEDCTHREDVGLFCSYF